MALRARTGMTDWCLMCGSHRPYQPGDKICGDCYDIGHQLWPFQIVTPQHAEIVRSHRWGLIHAEEEREATPARPAALPKWGLSLSSLRARTT